MVIMLWSMRCCLDKCVFDSNILFNVLYIYLYIYFFVVLSSKVNEIVIIGLLR